MADHRAYQAIKKLRDILLAGNTLAGDRVTLGEVATVDTTAGPCIDINIGPDSPVSKYGTDNTLTIDSVHRVYVDELCESTARGEKMLDQLYGMRVQVHALLLADPTLGLSDFVEAVRYQGTEDVRDMTGAAIVGVVRTVWDIGYRMNYASAT